MEEMLVFSAFTICPIENGIFHIDFTGEAVTPDVIIQLYDELEKMGNGQQVGILNVFTGYVPPNEKVMEYIASNRPKKIIFASAIVVQSVSMQLVMGLFMEFFNKQKVDRKIFFSEKKAMIWLRKMRDEARKKRMFTSSSALLK